MMNCASSDLARKLQAVSLICLMTASVLSFGTVAQNTTLLNAYIRHTVAASQDLTGMIADRAGTTAEQQILSDHLIRLGRHTALLNANVLAVENAILANTSNFVNGDFSKQILDLQTKLNALGFQGTLQNPDATHRALTLAKVQKYGLRGYLRMTGTAIEQLGVSYVSPYAENKYGEPMLMPADARLLLVVRPVCDSWANVSGDLFAFAAIAALAGQEQLGIMLAGSGGIVWLYSRYIC